MFRQLIPSKFCLACRKCCRFIEKSSIWTPQLTKDEAKYLKIKLKRLNLRKFLGHACSSSVESGSDMSPEYIFICSHLNITNNKCAVYKMRPFECRLYPYLINRQNDSIFLAIDPYCLYAEKKLNTKILKKYAEDLSRFLNTKTFRVLLKNNPGFIHTYPGVINLIKLKIK